MSLPSTSFDVEKLKSIIFFTNTASGIEKLIWEQFMMYKMGYRQSYHQSITGANHDLF